MDTRPSLDPLRFHRAVENSCRSTVGCARRLQSQSGRSLRENAGEWCDKRSARHRQTHLKQPADARLASLGHAEWQLYSRPDIQLDRVHRGPGGKDKLSTSLRVRRDEEIPRRFNARRSKLAVYAATLYFESGLSCRDRSRAFVSPGLASRPGECRWESRALHVRQYTPIAFRCAIMRTLLIVVAVGDSDGGLAIALAESAVDRVHLLLANESRSCAHVMSDGVMCRFAVELSEQPRGRVALRRQNPRLPLCFQPGRQLRRRSGLPCKTHIEVYRPLVG